MLDYQVYGRIVLDVEIDYAFLCGKSRKNTFFEGKKVQFLDPSMTKKVTAMAKIKNTDFTFFPLCFGHYLGKKNTHF